MIELLLFLGVICLLFFIPVCFEISYRKVAWDDQLVLEMSFFYGLLKRKKTVSFFKPEPFSPRKEVRKSGRWFFIRKSQSEVTSSSITESSRSWREFFDRLDHYGPGVTLLTYFLPAQYQNWLLVVEELEHKGSFQKLTWNLRFGTGNAARTAQLYGILWSVQALIIGFLQSLARFRTPPDLRIVPDFQKPRLDVVFHCIFRVKLGHIIIASLWTRFRYRLLKGGASH